MPQSPTTVSNWTSDNAPFPSPGNQPQKQAPESSLPLPSHARTVSARSDRNPAPHREPTAPVRHSTRTTAETWSLKPGARSYVWGDTNRIVRCVRRAVGNRRWGHDAGHEHFGVIQRDRRRNDDFRDAARSNGGGHLAAAADCARRARRLLLLLLLSDAAGSGTAGNRRCRSGSHPVPGWLLFSGHVRARDLFLRVSSHPSIGAPILAPRDRSFATIEPR